MSTLQVNRIIPLTGDSVFIQGAVIDSASFASTASYVASVASSSYSTFAVTASYVLIAQTASFVANAVTASYVASAVSASRATSAANADTASYILNAVSASYALTSSYAASVGINFVQSSPSSTWTINHNLNNKYPLVQIYDSSDAVIIPATIVGTNTNTVTVTFSTAISGYARVI
jgi:hypothetical protein